MWCLRLFNALSLTYKFTPSPFLLPLSHFSLTLFIFSQFPFLFPTQSNSSNLLCFSTISCIAKMTNQNVIISDPRSGFDSSLLSLSPAVPGPLPQPGRFIAVPAKRSFKNIDSTDAARITALLDSMRASSPTRRSSETENLNSWIVSSIYSISIHQKKINFFLLEY